MDGKQLQQQYKHHISDYTQWEQREHASEWMLFEQNMGTHLSIDETALSKDELYTIVTNKAARGRKGAIVAMIKGTQAEQVIEVLKRLPGRVRKAVQEVILDMAAGMKMIVRRCFPHAHLVIDRFHVQQLASEAVQEMRIKYRWEALDQENEQIIQARRLQRPFYPNILANGDTLKQLLARGRYLLYKHKSLWTPTQRKRAELMFDQYPSLQQAYELSLRLADIFRHCINKEQAYKRLALWYNDVEAAGIESFKTVCRSIQAHYLDILNFFTNRSTNASAESFNAKIKSFRASARGVRDINFFLFRLAKIYA